jgi:hypothetical protein
MENIDSWDFLKFVLSGVVTGLSFVMVYFFNQIQMMKEKITDNKQAIALNDQHDINTDRTLLELKSLIERLESKIDTLILKK